MDMQYGSDYGQVLYSLDTGNTWTVLGSYNDGLGHNWYTTSSGGTSMFTDANSGWIKSTYKLEPNTFNQPVPIQFMFRFIANSSINNYDGWAIDDFCLTPPPLACDVGVASIDYPIGDTAIGSSVYVTATIENYGSDTLTNIPVELKLVLVVLLLLIQSHHLRNHLYLTYLLTTLHRT